jgi:hypothetical protein
MWSGSSGSFVNMNPPGASSSGIRAAYGDRQGGAASFSGSFSPSRAGLWSGTAASFVSLHPLSGYAESWITAMAEGQQVGAANAGSTTMNHAALRTGTPESFLDLHPAGYISSELLGTVGGAQVSFVYTGQTHAGIWFGTAGSFLRLSQFLPAGYYDSKATSIATDGQDFYVGGYATNAATGYRDAFLWVGTVPAPSTMGVLMAAGVLASRRRRVMGPCGPAILGLTACSCGASGVTAG